MISASELRIGNWLLFSNKIEPDSYVQVNAWFLRQLVHDINDTDPEVNHFYQPIRLSKKVLENCGFNYFTLDYECTDPVDAYWVHPKMKFAINNLSWTVQHIATTVRYLHDLQNLYYALNKEELIFNH